MIDPLPTAILILLGVGIGLIVADRRQKRRDDAAKRSAAQAKEVTEQMDRTRRERALQLDPELRAKAFRSVNGRKR
jgi:hypothetical protein